MSTGVYRNDNASGNQLKEDLADLITDLSPTMTPIYTGLSKTKASNTLHEWLNDTVDRATAVSSMAEGADVTFADLASPSRGSNYVQEISQPFKISQKHRDSASAGYSDPVAYFQAKAMKSWKLKAEYALIHGTGNSGQSGVAWEMTGLRKAITTNYYSAASGTSLTEKLFNDVLQLAYEDVEDDSFEFYGSMFHKRQISAFTSGTTKNIDATDRRLINAIDIYQSDVAANVKLFAHRDIPVAKNFFLVIQPKAFSIAFMHSPTVMDSASTGPYTAKYVYGSLTLEYKQEKAGVRGENFLNT